MSGTTVTPSPSASDPSAPHELDAALEQLAVAPLLLVASDYDGTLAEIVDDPAAAFPVRDAIVALRQLAELPATEVAVISGRSLAELARLSGLPASVHLVGSHGSEFDAGFARELDDDVRDRLRELDEALVAIADELPGAALERKPASIAFHYRHAAPDAAQAAVARIESELAVRDGVHAKHGKCVIELSVMPLDKGLALETIRHRAGAAAVLFIGDDVTDEDAFGRLRGPDVGIKVGPGATIAPLHVDDPAAVARLLAELAERRSAWAAGAGAVPIEEHAILSDLRTVALVTPRARVSWLCAPRLDAPAIFAELLGGPVAGFFSVEDAAGGEPEGQAWRGDSLVLETRFPSFTVTDFLDASGGRTDHRPGRTDLVRIVEGRGRVRVVFAPRLDFGRLPTRLERRDGGIEIVDAPEPMVLRAPADGRWTIEESGPHQIARCEVDLEAGVPATFTLRFGVGTLRKSLRPSVERRAETERFWIDWASALAVPDDASIPPARREAVIRSALMLRALVHGPTGAIAAAATTSLPEEIGGVRNWDYRYCWPRDAAIAANALVKLGRTTEAMAFLDWMFEVLEHCEQPDRLQPLYGLGGEPITFEGEIGELAGYAGSRPVRVGNLAAKQVQLDVFGPVADLVHELAVRDAPLSAHHWRLVDSMVRAVDARWSEPDHGIWEIRGPKRHHVHSRVMCWQTVDRAIRVAEALRDHAPASWHELRDRIAHDILEKGWSNRAGAFTGAYGETAMDAAVLHVGLSGLLPADDPRWLATVDAVERTLLEDDTGVYRYRHDDGLPGFEGTFTVCTGWLVLARLVSGRPGDAETLLDRMIDFAGTTGTLAEEHDVGANRALGNVPQAYSHAAVIEGVLAVAGRRSGD